ncbi:unnamed protein product [Acanthoscelides obtectus]|uniref:Uncharacterized protein n=1 Tax=Acanthoscelides obtectus TaxID=200917 RepID=A0A9P0JR81_ACAOB|nr:unnamed protein product [Acanthoscelides obtectus]CAK1641375.1 hypothetical protein AOBTE_LOCUS12370 [Acanthoscelides obtectus]
MEQLSKFMGHTLKTHCDFYRLSDSLFQTAKISKLLLLATEGGLEKYKGMPLDEISIDLSPISEDCDLEDVLLSGNSEQSISTSKGTEIQKPKMPVKKQSWTHEQKKVISEYFAEHIIKNELLSKWK